jgi:hypothetical protein
MWKFTDTSASDAGSVGGDIQVGAAWSRRLVWSDDAGNPLPIGVHADTNAPVFAVIDDAWYAVDVNLERSEEDRPAPDDYYFDVQNQCWECTCTDLDDVGGTEITSEYQYTYVNDIGFDSQERADAYAKQCAENARDDVYGAPGPWK